MGYINSLVDHAINNLKYKPLSGNYIKLLKELDHPKKVLISIANLNDSECSKWCLVRYFHPADHKSARIRKRDKDFAKEVDFKEMKFLFKIRDKNW